MKTPALFLLGWLALTPASAMQNVTIEVVQQPRQMWNFQHIQAAINENRGTINGRLTSELRSALPHGHVDIAVFSAAGELLVETAANYHPGTLTLRAKRKGGVRFSAQLTTPLPEDAIIKMAFHHGPISPPVLAPHQSIFSR